MKQEKQTARGLALNSLVALERDGKYSNIEVDSVLKKHDLSQADKALFTRLLYGVTERKITLDYIISKYSSKTVDELDGEVLNALRLGIYQLVYMDRIPEHAAVGETAGLVKKSAVGYVNAVLRTFIRSGKKYELPGKEDYIRYLSVRYSVPEVLAAHFADSYGKDEAEPLLEALNREPKTGLRINTLKISREEALMRTGGTMSSFASDIILVSGLDENVREGIDEGLWFVQDEASRIATVFLGAQPGETVIDVCACPGGKSFSAAIDMENKGKLYSFDLHKNKLSLVERGAAKLGIDILSAEERDGRNPDETLTGKADRVICDVPCSGFGVIAKKPDIRYKNPAEAERLPGIQYDILVGASGYVKPGGVLVYSTCTLNPAENDEVVYRFIESHKDFILEDSRTFMPHKDGCDGFFAARLIKK